MNDRVAAYRGLVESIALKVSRGPRAIRLGAEYDDLVQEGLIKVWRALQAGATPSAEIVEMRMRDYLRWLARPTAIPYEDMLPLHELDRAGA